MELGVIYYETLTGQTPFRAEGSLAVLRAVTQDPLTHARQLKPELPPLADEIITRALEKDCARRYQTAAEMERDIRKLLGEVSPETAQARRSVKWIAAGAVLVLAAAGVAGWLAYRYVSERKWAQSEAPAQIENLVETHRPLQALALLERAEKDLPKNESGNGRLRELAGSYMQTVSVTSDPAGAEVAIQDYLTPDGAWKTLGKTPIAGVRIPKGYFRWKLAQPGLPDVVVAPITGSKMEFPLAEMRKAPQGMVYSPGGSYGEYVDILGWTGPYPLPPYYIDRYEVTNREYQQFVDSGGYSNPQYWPAALQKDGKTISRGEAMAEFPRHERPSRAFHVDGGALSRGPGKLSRLRRELVRGCGIRGVGGQKPSHPLPVGAVRSCGCGRIRRSDQQLRALRRRAGGQIPGPGALRHLRHGRQRKRVGRKRCR